MNILQQVYAPASGQLAAMTRKFPQILASLSVAFPVVIPAVARRMALVLQEYAERMGPTIEALNSLAGLDLSLQCDAFIGTQSSNWGRLIDELRGTVGCAADRIYLDAAMGDPPSDVKSMQP